MEEPRRGPCCMRLLALRVIALCLLAASLCLAAEPPARNAIVFIVDGCASEQYTLARWFKGAKAQPDLSKVAPVPLAFDPFRVGAVRTFIADSAIADSAPAGTAYATGRRTSDKFIGVGPKDEGLLGGVEPPDEGHDGRPLATLLEAAKRAGKATGIVVTCRLSHATPAAFVAHTCHRDAEEEIMEQLVHQGVDVALGGGREFLRPASMGGKRADGQNLLNTLRRAGYQLATSRAQLAAATQGKLFGLFAEGHLNPEVDQPSDRRKQPTLLEMTKKAVELLSAHPAGFFLMIEASQVDWANHANDPAYLLHELLAADDAMAFVLDFAAKDANKANTLVLILSDHNTGGMSIGNYRSDKTYSQTDARKLLDPLVKMKRSAEYVWKKLGDDRTPERVQAVVREYWGMDVTAGDAALVLAVAAKAKPAPESYALGEVLCPRYTYVGWTTHGHAGGDVPLFAHVPDAAWAAWLKALGQPPGARALGVVDGPRVGQLVAESLGLDLQKLTDELFAPVETALPGCTALVEEDRATRRLALVVEFDPNDKDAKAETATARLWVNTNRFEVNGKPMSRPLSGPVIYAPLADRAYLPKDTLAVLRAEAAAGR